MAHFLYTVTVTERIPSGENIESLFVFATLPDAEKFRGEVDKKAHSYADRTLRLFHNIYYASGTESDIMALDPL